MSSILDMSHKELSTTLKLTNLNGEPIIIHPKKLLSINPEQLANDIQDMAVDTYTVERAKDVAELDAKNAKHAVQIIHSQLFMKESADDSLWKLNRGHKPTTSLIESKINTIPQYNRLIHQANHKVYIFQVLKDLSYDLVTKSNLLQTESSNLRQQENIRENNA